MLFSISVGCFHSNYPALELDSFIQWQQEIWESSSTASATVASPLRVQKKKPSSKFELITVKLVSRTAATQAASQQMLLTVLTHAV